MMKRCSLIGLTLIVYGTLYCNGAKTAEEHMHEMDFDELVQHFEGKERDEYQRPDALLGYLEDLLKARASVGAPSLSNGWNGITVADLGAGTGYFSVRLARRGASVIALDIDPRFLDYIKNREEYAALSDRLELRKVEPSSIGLKKQEVDVIFSVNVYHHIQNRIDYFKAAKTSIKPGGLLIIIDFKKESKIGPPERMKIAKQDVVSELSKAGYQVDVEDQFLPEQNIYLAIPQ
ncbi:MAG: class I SAM-dependent methyltransferase [Leptospiraceae bacterium]|nr:class I SAM-dependent methyltransferase [Leptospiraceae bacterium]